MKKVLKASGKLAVATVAAGVSALLAAVRFLAGAETTPPKDELSSPVRGGLLSYRTGKFDDGTNPAGIYKPD